MTSSPLTLLAFDSATTGCSITVWRDGEVLAHDAREMSRGQAEVLMPMAQAALKTAGVTAKQLDGVAITRGPGAFTGMRIGLAAARGFALALNVPCIGLTTLEVVAQGVRREERIDHIVLSAVDSKRADIYVQLFDGDLNPLSEACAADGPALAAMIKQGWKLLVVGDGASRAKEMLNAHGIETHLSAASALPDTRLIAQIAAARFEAQKDSPPPQPLYLRPPDAKLPKNQGRARP